MPATSEWVAWHQRYEREPSLVERLREVQGLIVRTLDQQTVGTVRVISMCAGDGRDLLGAIAEHPRRHDVSARLVELEPELATAGRDQARRLGLTGIHMVVGDASTSSAYEGAVPADIVLVCGVFGNITDQDIRRTIRHLPELCAAGATVVWTRGRFEPDLTPQIREWFAEDGFTELAFVTIPGSTSAVAAHRLHSAPRAFRTGVRLFTFLPEAERPSRRHDAGVH